MVSVASSTGTILTSTDGTSSTSSTTSSTSTNSSGVPSAASTGQSLITLSGLGSGIDTTSIVNQLMAAEGVPRDQVYQKQEWVEWQQDAYRSINTALSTFQAAEQNLRFQSTFNPYTASSSDTTDVTATTGSNVLQGSYQVQVNSTAASATLISGNIVNNQNNTAAQPNDKVLAAGTSGSFQIAFNPSATNTTGKPNSVEIDVSDTDTFQTIASKITNAGIGLKATFDSTTSRFVLSSTSTGNLGTYSISDLDGGTIGASIVNGGNATGSLAADTGTTTPVAGSSFSGTDASVDIYAPGSTNKITVTQSTNNISALGLNLNLINKTSGPVNINVQVDTDSVYNNITGFINAYNTLMDTINTQLTSKRNYDYPPLTQSQKSAMTDSQISLWEAKAKSGVLEADPLMQGIADQLQNAVNNPVKSISSGSYNTLSSIGVGIEFVKSNGTLVTDPTNSGHLQYDETTLRAAIANNPTQVMNLFTASDPNATGTTKARTDYEGIGQRLYDVTNSAIKQLVNEAGLPGGSYNDGSSLGNQVKDLSDQLSDWADRLKALQDRYNQQFTAMETAINQFNSQGSYLSQLMG